MLRESKRNDDREWCDVVTNRALGSKIIRGGGSRYNDISGGISVRLFFGWCLAMRCLVNRSSIGRKISVG